MEIQLIRHATLRVRIDALTLLVDPMLGAQGSLPPIPNTANPVPNPLVPLPMPVEEILRGVDAVLVTHVHRDHWDQTASESVPRDMRILCQPQDVTFFRALGFLDVFPVHSAAAYGMVTIMRTAGEHGTGEIAEAMAPVSGYLLRSRAGESLYIAGDTILCDAVRTTVQRFSPQVVVVNAGEARFLEGDAITMGAEDVSQLALLAPEAQLVAVHMEAINHCGLHRRELAEFLSRFNLPHPVLMPADGECLVLTPELAQQG